MSMSRRSRQTHLQASGKAIKARLGAESQPQTLMGVWASVMDEQSHWAFKDLWRKPGKQSDEAAQMTAPACDTGLAELWPDMKRPAPH